MNDISSANSNQPQEIDEGLILNQYEEAADLLEQSTRVGKGSPELSYLLAMAYKRQGKSAEALAALRKIPEPDANVHLQMGIIAFKEKDYASAEKEFSKALELDATLYEAAYNQFLCRFCRGNFNEGAQLLPVLIDLAPTPGEKRLMSLLQVLLYQAESSQNSTAGSLPLPDRDGLASAREYLSQISPEEENRLLDLLHGMGTIDMVFPLLQTLAKTRPNSQAVQRTYIEMVLVQAARLADRCEWKEADKLLAPLNRIIQNPSWLGQGVSRNTQIAFLNLQGCCAAMMQDFDRAIQAFSSALQLASNDPWLSQNIALCYEYMEKLDHAEMYWNRYFDLLNNSVPTPAEPPNYLEMLAFSGVSRLSDLYSRYEKWSKSLGFLQRACRLRPKDVDSHERLFQLYVQLRRPEEARRILRKLREIRPGDPQFDLYELDLRDIRTLEDIDRILNDIKRVIHQHPGDIRVEDRAVTMVANCIPLIGRKCDQLSDKLGHIVDQVRRLPNYQINWPIVHDEMHFLRNEFQKLRKLSSKCLALVNNEETRQVIRDMNQHIDSKIEICISMGG